MEVVKSILLSTYEVIIFLSFGHAQYALVLSSKGVGTGCEARSNFIVMFLLAVTGCTLEVVLAAPSFSERDIHVCEYGYIAGGVVGCAVGVLNKGGVSAAR